MKGKNTEYKCENCGACGVVKPKKKYTTSFSMSGFTKKQRELLSKDLQPIFDNYIEKLYHKNNKMVIVKDANGKVRTYEL